MEPEPIRWSACSNPPVKRQAPYVVEYEPDSELRDTEQVPLLEEGGIEAFFRREVLPYAARRLVCPLRASRPATRSALRATSTSRSRCVTLEEIRADILALEKETGGLLGRDYRTASAS